MALYHIYHKTTGRLYSVGTVLGEGLSVGSATLQDGAPVTIRDDIPPRKPGEEWDEVAKGWKAAPPKTFRDLSKEIRSDPSLSSLKVQDLDKVEAAVKAKLNEFGLNEQ